MVLRLIGAVAERRDLNMHRTLGSILVQGCRESDILISKPCGGIGRVGSQIRCRSIRLPPTKPVYAQRSIRGVRDQGDAAGRGWAVSVSNQESTRVARARRKRERVEQGVTHRDFAPSLNVTMAFQLRL